MKNNFNNLNNPQIYESLGCTLQISGVGFNANEYFNKSNFTKDDVLFNGVLGLPDEIRAKVNKEELNEAKALTMFDSTILLIKVSEKVDIISQIKDATCFLEKYRNELKGLQSYPEVETVAMKFSCEQNENLSDFHDFSPEFYDLISEIGIENIMLG